MTATVPFRQYLRPDGRRQSGCFPVSDEVASKAEAIIAAGHRFECESLTSGHVSLTIHHLASEEDVAIEVVRNGPGVKEAIERMINGFSVAAGAAEEG
jgi:hypothetical protein